MAKAQIQQKEKDRRIVQLTISEIGSLPSSDDIKLYKGIGKMYAFLILRLMSVELIVRFVRFL